MVVVVEVTGLMMEHVVVVGTVTECVVYFVGYKVEIAVLIHVVVVHVAEVTMERVVVVYVLGCAAEIVVLVHFFRE